MVAERIGLTTFGSWPAEAQPVGRGTRNAVVVAIMLGMLLAALDQTIVATALARLQEWDPENSDSFSHAVDRIAEQMIDQGQSLTTGRHAAALV